MKIAVPLRTPAEDKDKDRTPVEEDSGSLRTAARTIAEDTR